MNKKLILKEIFDQNKHWKGDNLFFEGEKYKRKLFYELLDYLKERQIISIVGLRGTGKTILLKQLIKYLSNGKNINPVKKEAPISGVKSRQKDFLNGVDIDNIFFLSFDEALVTSKLTLKEYLDVYLEDIVKNNKKNRKYIFLDEIQYIDNWQHILKRYYDRDTNLKFIISGSSSLFLQKKTTESLAGRIYEFKLNYLSFEEFLEMSNVNKPMLNEFKKFAVTVGEKNISHSQNEYNIFLAKYGRMLESLFADYILYYQFPAMVVQPNKDKIRKYLIESIYKKTIEYDIPRLFSVEKVGELKFVYQMLVNEIGEIVEFKNISAEAGIEENTLKNYLYYFQESFLLDLIYNYSKSFRKSKRLQKKSYIASANFFTAFYGEYSKNDITANKHLGKLVEAYVLHRAKEKYQYISFYRKSNKEIDFVCSNDFFKKDSYDLIEVKYVNTIRQKDFYFIKKIAKDIFKIPRCLVYTKDYCQFTDDCIMLPCFLIK